MGIQTCRYTMPPLSNKKKLEGVSSKEQVCKACGGKGKNSKGKECYPCEGTGKIKPPKIIS